MDHILDARADAAKIAQLNDRFRTTFEGGAITMTHGVASMNADLRRRLVDLVRDPNMTFDEGDDPHEEHDFGAVTVEDVKYFWKIDCYAKDDFAHGSEDPSDPDWTTRVLTIMRADEY